MEYDWKRRPVDPCLRAVPGDVHLFFDTVPWATIEDFKECRRQWEGYRGGSGAVLKTVEDFRNFEDYRLIGVAPKGLNKPRKGSSAKIALRMLLRAYVRSEWGLDAEALSYSDLATWLTAEGYPTKKHDVENAHRPNAKLVEHTVPNTETGLKFTACVLVQFPSFEAHRLIVQDES